MSGIITQGTKIGISVDGVAYTSLGVVQSFTLSTAGRPEIDTTGLLDTSKTFKFGLKDNGTISVELLYDIEGAAQDLLEGSYNSNDEYFFEIEFANSLGTNGTIKTFKGFVISLSQDSQSDDVLRQSVEVKISGDVTTTPAA